MAVATKPPPSCRVIESLRCKNIASQNQGDIVVMFGGSGLKPIAKEGSTLGNAGAYGVPGIVVKVTKFEDPLLRTERRYRSVCGGS